MKATYAKDNRNEGVYNIRVAGAGCEGREGQSIDVETAGSKIRREVLGRQIWAGLDRDGQPCALYAKGVVGVPQPRQVPSDLEKRVWTLEQTVAALVEELRVMHSPPTLMDSPPHGDQDAPPPGDDDCPF